MIVATNEVFVKIIPCIIQQRQLHYVSNTYTNRTQVSLWYIVNQLVNLLHFIPNMSHMVMSNFAFP